MSSNAPIEKQVLNAARQHGRLLSAAVAGALLLAQVSAQAQSATEVFTSDTGTLARFELNGTVTDAGASHRDASPIGGSFVATTFGMGLQLAADPQGFDWSAYASLLHHPYSMEFVFTATNSDSYGKLFSGNDSIDEGYYLHNRGLSAFPNAEIGAGLIRAFQRNYLALVSTDASHADVYVNGQLAGNLATGTVVSGSQLQAIFLRDDSASSRNERVNGTLDAVRLSSVSRSASEIMSVARRVDCGGDLCVPTSRFDVDNDGWQYVNIGVDSYLPGQTPIGAAPFDSVNGNPAPSLHLIDLAGDTAAAAPAKFLGNQAALYGQSLSYDLYIRFTDNVVYDAVKLDTNGYQLTYDLPSPPINSWQHLVVPLTETGWVRRDAIGTAPASQADMQNAQANLTGLYIRTEWNTGEDDSNLDNVTIPLPAALPSLTIGDAGRITEGNSGTSIASFRIRLTPASNQPVTVQFSTANGTATAGSDYVAASSLVSFAPGQTSKTVTVTVNGDTAFEPDETFFGNLGNASGATIGDAQGLATIVNDDAAPPAPGIGVNVRSFDFGNVPVGTSSVQRMLIITSTGTLPLDIRQIRLVGDYTGTSNCPRTLAPGASCALTGNFRPTATGPRPGSVTVTSNAPDSPTVVQLSGNGT